MSSELNYTRIVEIKSVADARALCDLEIHYLFRGHSILSWDLIPSIGRSRPISDDEEGTFLKKYTIELRGLGYFDQGVKPNDFWILAHAQHYGYPTRMLDWTYDVRVALFLACDKDVTEDGCVWMFQAPIYEKGIWVDELNEGNGSPFLNDRFKFLICSPLIDDLPAQGGKQKEIAKRRVFRQKSVMTIHPKKDNGTFADFRELKDKYPLTKVIVAKDYKQQISKELREDEGNPICDETLFRGGTAASLKSTKIFEEFLRKFKKGK